jgi:hypothetical protein
MSGFARALLHGLGHHPVALAARADRPDPDPVDVKQDELDDAVFAVHPHDGRVDCKRL